MATAFQKSRRHVKDGPAAAKAEKARVARARRRAGKLAIHNGTDAPRVRLNERNVS